MVRRRHRLHVWVVFPVRCEAPVLEYSRGASGLRGAPGVPPHEGQRPCERGDAHGQDDTTSAPVLRLVHCGHDVLYGPGVDGRARRGFEVFVLPMSEEFGWDRRSRPPPPALVSGLSQPFLGRLYDRLGGRRLILAGLVVSGVYHAPGPDHAHSVSHPALGGVLSVAMGGSSLTTTAALLAKWFDRHRATAVSLNAAGRPWAAWCSSVEVYLIHLVGWRVTWVVLWLLVLLAVVPLAYVLLKDDPAELGPDGAPQPPETHQAAPRRPGPLEVVSWRDAFRSTPIWQLCGGYCVRLHHRPGLDPFRAVRHRTRRVRCHCGDGLWGDERPQRGGRAGGGGPTDAAGAKTCSDSYALRGCAYAALLFAPGAWSLWGFVVIMGSGGRPCR